MGVTPSAWSTIVPVQVKNGFIGGLNNRVYVGANNYYDGTNSRYIATDFASRYYQNAGTHVWETAPSGTAGNAITFTQAMTLDASGRLGIGETSPAATLDVKGAGGVGRINSSDANGAYITFANSGTAKGQIGSAYHIVTSGSANDYALTAVNNLIFAAGGSTERARIDSSGSLLGGLTSASSGGFASGTKFAVNAGANLAAGFRRAESSGTNEYIRFTDGDDADCGSIDVNATANTTAYNTSSDYRLKQDIASMTGALAKVAVLNPCTWNWKHAPEVQGQGFIAHELAEVVPDCVTGVKDEVDQEGNPVYQGIDTSFLVATLTSALQELNAKFEAYVASHP